MKHYLKIENNAVIEAPKTIVKDVYTIYGYNSEDNEAMLLEDGYTIYPKAACYYQIKNGQIVEKQPEPEEEIHVYSKLKIRRACRELGIEDKLTNLIQSSQQFYMDWHDAQDIDLNDPMIIQAVQAGILTQEQINAIKEILK